MGNLYSLSDLSHTTGGLVTNSSRFQTAGDEPRLAVRIEQINAVSQVWNQSAQKTSSPRCGHSIQGAAVGLDDADAQVRASAEALERYCCSTFMPDQFVRASAAELGTEALDLDVVPRCSARETAHPKAPLGLPDKNAPIRWVRSVSLHSGRIVYVPVVMVYLHAGFATRAERFYFPISTGCAAHPCFEQAILSAILEVVERDAISVLWLQKLSVPRLVIDAVPGVLEPYWDRYLASSKDLEYAFFDATSDVGITTVYGIQTSAFDRRAATLVSCSTACDPGEAVVGVMREMSSIRTAFRQPRQIPEDTQEFADIFDGATYMARAENAHAFDFVLQSESSRKLTNLPSIGGDATVRLRFVLERLQHLGMDVYAVDLSTDEAVRAGMKVVKVLIPSLQPISFNHRARYLGHPRLYEAPRKMGYRTLDENQLNPWPQPFA